MSRIRAKSEKSDDAKLRVLLRRCRSFVKAVFCIGLDDKDGKDSRVVEETERLASVFGSIRIDKGAGII